MGFTLPIASHPGPTTGIVPGCPGSSEETIHVLELRCTRGFRVVWFLPTGL